MRVENVIHQEKKQDLKEHWKIQMEGKKKRSSQNSCNNDQKWSESENGSTILVCWDQKKTSFYCQKNYYDQNLWKIIIKTEGKENKQTHEIWKVAKGTVFNWVKRVPWQINEKHSMNRRKAMKAKKHVTQMIEIDKDISRDFS